MRSNIDDSCAREVPTRGTNLDRNADPDAARDICRTGHRGLMAGRAGTLLRTTVLASLIALGVMLLSGAASALGATEISGTVTNAETHAGISGVTVCLYKESGELIECTSSATNGAGEYEIEPKEGEGHYSVGFFVAGFVNQYYNDVAAVYEATPVHVTNGKTTENIDAELEKTGEGAVSGRVTNTSNGQGTGGVEVCIYGEFSHCVETNSNSEYTISGIPAGSYSIFFSAAPACEEEQGEKIRCQPKSNYISQSTSVKVKANKTETVDAALQIGGQISGTVTSASLTHPGVVKIEVCATKVTGTTHEYEEYASESCAFTNSAGQYTVPGLESGAYKVEFNGTICTIIKKGERECPQVYVTQYYHGKQTHRQAETIAVTAGLTTSGINESLREAFPTTPASAAAPELTGTAIAGSVLTCSQGTWAHEPTYVVYQWLRGGAVISGQSGDTYTLQTADQGQAITCVVTAGNGAGASSAMSDVVKVAQPLAVSGASAKVNGRVVMIKLTCTGGGICSGTLKLMVHGKGGTVIGQAHFSIASNKSATVRVNLVAKGRSLLSKTGKRGLKVTLTGTGVRSRTLVLKKSGASKKKQKK